MSELLGCPFCGRVPNVSHRASSETETKEVWFASCFCDGFVTHAWQSEHSFEALAEVWNKRHNAVQSKKGGGG